MDTILQAQASSRRVASAAEWSAAVFARNEAPSLAACLRALARAGEGVDLRVTVLLNGSTDGSAEIAVAALRETGLRGSVHAIAQGDKANAFNQFIHRLRPEAATYIFVDGYAAVAPGALRHLAARLRDAPQAQAAAAVPSTGRSAAFLTRQMLEEPGLHGSLFALRGSFVARLASLGLRLPVGLYRGDGLVGSFVLHDLDAERGGWVLERLAVEPGATWRAPSLRLWHPRDARRHWHRLVQQGRGRLQWAAIRDAIYPGGFTALPEDADTCVLDWIAAAPRLRTPRLWRDPFAVLALRRMRGARPRLDLTPRLLAEVEAR
ncbi:glycosyl transferase family 2 [Humitalea rosea]|uniref:Glycosyl transferase family 2 n=1 Tax=Humitalea rosea TaxID=990373 RepID=A0A2W7IJ90_9PROT|nr:glycosyltransferase [Humitalea rosea]PZW46773.1 glycosyl transferase family 2 [Humitalea rosea]